MKELTLREKAAIAFYLAEGKVSQVSPRDLYLIGHHKAAAEVLNMKHLASAASHWFSAKPIQDYLRTQQLRQEDKRKQIEAEILARVQESNPDASITNNNGVVDYSNPDNRRRLYTAIINKSKDDPKTQLDAAKMFEQIQKDDREAAKAQKQTAVYLPLRCESCPLYKREREKLETKSK